MSSQTLDATLEKLRDRAESSPEFADALVRLAQWEPPDVFEEPDDEARFVATVVNRQRQADRIADLRARSLTTSQVVALLATVSDRKGVDRRRSRGQLLGLRHGRQMLHPEWQFDRRRGDTYEGLEQVLSVLREVAGDDIDADAIAVSERPEVGGRSPAQLLADGNVDLAVEVVRLAGDQS